MPRHGKKKPRTQMQGDTASNQKAGPSDKKGTSKRHTQSKTHKGTGTSRQKKASRRPPIKRTIKDSVFCDLFRDPQMAYDMYKSLHPEDHTTTAEQIRVATLKSVLLNGIQNDFAMQVGDQFLIFAEEQTQWSENIMYRLLQYAAETLSRYVAEKGLDVHAAKAIQLPEPEYYIIYPGSKDVGEIVSIEDLHGWRQGFMSLKAKVIRPDNASGILADYLRFVTKLEDTFTERGRSMATVEEIIDECIEEGILSDYLRKRRVEVVRYMNAVFDQAEAMRVHDLQFTRQIEQEKAKTNEATKKAKSEKKKACAATKKAHEATKMAHEATKMAEEEKKKADEAIKMVKKEKKKADEAIKMVEEEKKKVGEATKMAEEEKKRADRLEIELKELRKQIAVAR